VKHVHADPHYKAGSAHENLYKGRRTYDYGGILVIARFCLLITYGAPSDLCWKGANAYNDEYNTYDHDDEE
jgi:hypothetical protein